MHAPSLPAGPSAARVRPKPQRPAPPARSRSQAPARASPAGVASRQAAELLRPTTRVHGCLCGPSHPWPRGSLQRPPSSVTAAVLQPPARQRATALHPPSSTLDVRCPWRRHSQTASERRAKSGTLGPAAGRNGSCAVSEHRCPGRQAQRVDKLAMRGAAICERLLCASALSVSQTFVRSG